MFTPGRSHLITLRRFHVNVMDISIRNKKGQVIKGSAKLPQMMACARHGDLPYCSIITHCFYKSRREGSNLGPAAWKDRLIRQARMLVRR